MALKLLVDTLTEVPEALRGEYEPKDGKFRLKTEGDTPEFVDTKAKLAEFRDNNKKMHDELTNLKAKLQSFDENFAGVDPAEYRKLKEQVEALRLRGVGKPEDLQAAIQSALKELNEKELTPLRKDLEKEKTARAETQAKLNKAKMREVIGGALSKAGALPDALDFLLSKAETTFLAEDGEVKALPDKFSKEKPTEALSVDEWIKDITRESAFAFEKSKGGGASSASNGRGKGNVLVNPSPAQLGQYADKIAKGELIVVHE